MCGDLRTCDRDQSVEILTFRSGAFRFEFHAFYKRIMYHDSIFEIPKNIKYRLRKLILMLEIGAGSGVLCCHQRFVCSKIRVQILAWSRSRVLTPISNVKINFPADVELFFMIPKTKIISMACIFCSVGALKRLKLKPEAVRLKYEYLVTPIDWLVRISGRTLVNLHAYCLFNFIRSIEALWNPCGKNSVTRPTEQVSTGMRQRNAVLKNTFLRSCVDIMDHTQ